ncbi:MAG: hypothetical protein Q7K34_00205 [archaeon]|nr:hypothetical protein [archaeon]
MKEKAIKTLIIRVATAKGKVKFPIPALAIRKGRTPGKNWVNVLFGVPIP